jgi:signal recognition particle subunit SRP54
VEAIIRSMTATERAKPEIINGSRRTRIAMGSGTTVADVNRLVKQFSEMQKMMKRMGIGAGKPGKKGKKGGRPGGLGALGNLAGLGGGLGGGLPPGFAGNLPPGFPDLGDPAGGASRPIR